MLAQAQLIPDNGDISNLIDFMRLFVGQGKPEYKVPYGKIPEFLPYELKILYHEFGNFPAFHQLSTNNPTLPLNDDWTFHLLHNQDGLTYLNKLKIEDDQVVFAWENQGNWKASTDIYNDNPPVFSNAADNWNEEQKGMIKICHQVSHFLTTFCLSELALGAKYSLQLKEPFQEDYQNIIHESQKLWLNGVYVAGEARHNFYLFEDIILVSEMWGGWISTNFVSNWKYFKIKNA
ncbi:MAG: hypothetical protein H7Y04_15820 [Verrucomicrobia bacterium]|nr:hypothetical protein [Cytophagales bacterium]